MNKKAKNSKNIDFLLENNHYKRLHLALYLISISMIVLVYFLTIMIFSQYFHFIITTLFSFLIGLYVVFNRSKLVKVISNILQDKKRLKYKKESKEKLKTTLRNITPKNKNLKLDIKGKLSIKEKAKKLKNKISSSKNKPQKDYIEIE